jgi:hypothetical protein
MGEIKNECKIFVGNPEGKRLLGRYRRRSKDNIKIDLKEIEWEDVDWIHLAWDSDLWRDLVNTVTNLRDLFLGWLCN